MKRMVVTLLFLALVSTDLFGQQESFSSMLNLAREGKAWAQNEVGLMYSLGEGVKQDRRKAVYWLKKSAQQNFPLGACSLGMHYGYGWGVRRNFTIMLKWVFIGEILDPLRCGSDFAKPLNLSECQIEKGWDLAVAWLRAHPELKSNFGQRPWLEDSDSENQKLKKKCKGSAAT